MSTPALITAEHPPDQASGGRERYLDVYRAVALVRVVVYHMFGFAWLSFLFPAMGVMFAVAGSLTAKSLEHKPASTVVWTRARRVLPSLWALGAIVVPAMLLHGWSISTDGSPMRWQELVYWIVPVLDPPGSEWAANAVGPLWYIRAYLWFVLLSPLLLWAFRRWPIATVAAQLALVVGAGLGVPDLGSLGATGSALSDFATYGACWVLGFAHRSGALQRIRMPVALGLAAVVMTAGLAWALNNPRPEFGLDLNEIPVAQALWSVGVVLILLRLAPRMDWIDRVPWLGWLVGLISARAVTIYLWHNIAIDLSFPVNDFLGRYTMIEYFITALILTAVAVLLFGWVEDLAARRPVRLLPVRPTDVRRTRRPMRRWRMPRLTRWYAVVTLAVLLVPAVLVGRAVTDDAAPLAYTPVQSWSASAYLVPWDAERGLASLSQAAEHLTAVSPVWYTPDDDGNIVRNLDTSTEPVASTARELGLGIVPSISNYRGGDWDGDLVSRIVHDPELRREHVQAIVDLVVGQGWDGIDIDYEAIDDADLEAFGGFVGELADSMHEVGRRVTVAAPAGTPNNRPELATLYEALGEAADEVRLMAYDKAWNESPPGPVAPAIWVDEVLNYAIAHIPREKIVLGLAAHGYDWAGSRGVDVMWEEAEQLADRYGREVQWSKEHQAPWFTYTTDGGVQRTVWYEDAKSLAAKRELADRYGLGGVFVWRLGGEDPETWSALSAGRAGNR